MKKSRVVGLKKHPQVSDTERELILSPVALIKQQSETKEKHVKVDSQMKVDKHTERAKFLSAGQKYTGKNFNLQSAATGTDILKEVSVVEGEACNYNVNEQSRECGGNDEVAVRSKTNLSRNRSDRSSDKNSKSSKEDMDKWVEWSEERTSLFNDLKQQQDSEWDRSKSLQYRLVNWMSDPEYESLYQMKQWTVREPIPKPSHQKKTRHGSSKDQLTYAQVLTKKRSK